MANSAETGTESSTHYQRDEGAVERREKQGDWWPKEQVHNAAAFEKLQTELQVLREEIQTHLAGKEKGKCSQNDKEKDVSEQTQRRGTELDRLNVLSMSKGVIGLGQSSIITDYPSSYTDPAEYSSISLSQAEIGKCKAACTIKDLTKNREEFSFEVEVGKQKTVEGASGRYFVEFPLEEDDRMEITNNTLQEEEEKKLALAMTTTLVLKRPREYNIDDSNDDDILEHWCNSKRYKKETHLLLMTEEAGLTMPPTFQ